MKYFYLAIMVMSLSPVSFANKLIFPDSHSKMDLKVSDPFQLAQAHLGLKLHAEDFKLTETRKSLLGTHFYYQQVHHGFKVEGAELVVTINTMGKLTKIYNNSTQLPSIHKKAFIPMLSESMAMEHAWAHLASDGKLLERPTSTLLFRPDFGLVFKVNISTSSPFGHYSIIVDATDGRVLSVEDAALPRMKRAESQVKKQNLNSRVIPFRSALADFEKSEIIFNLFENVSFVSGSAQVFDPNPVVTLGRTDLQDDSGDSLFTLAYKNEELKDISFSNGVYNLRGPKVTLIDFEGPRVAPSTSSDGNWVFERSNDEFNDAMTYLHIDRSVRYIESLGFTGQHAVL